MSTAMAVSRQTQLVAGMTAAAVTLLSVGGQLSLADHYAQSGAAMNPTNYAALPRVQMAARTTCPKVDSSAIGNLSAPRSAKDGKLNKTA